MQIVHIAKGSSGRHSAEVIGAKAANLARMAAAGLPVPPAFVLPVKLCKAIVDGERHAQKLLVDGLAEGIAFLEDATSLSFGGSRRPLLVSVRSGAARSMPGMLDTVLDVGCAPAAVHGLVRMTGHPRFAWDCRRRFLESYASVVLGLDRRPFARHLADMVAAEGVAADHALDVDAMERLTGFYLQMIEDQDCVVPDDPMEQIEASAQAVYRSWNSDRARTYRQLAHLEALHGTAVTVQAMVFGNCGLDSGSGVAFSRDPSTGAARPVIDVLFESQGEDVVSGTRTPETEGSIQFASPAVAAQLGDTLAQLEHEFGDVQDVEFTIENGKLWILQTRDAKRTPQAALRFVMDFVKEGLLTPREALQRLNGLDFSKLTRKRLAEVYEPAAHGTGASAGIAVSRASFDSDSAGRIAAGGDPAILVRPDTNTDDIVGFNIAAGIVTAIGGRTAHAALVARQMGKPCVVGCTELAIDVAGYRARLAAASIKEGDWLSIDGEAGTIYLGQCKVVTEQLDTELAEIERWRMAAPAL